MTGRLLEQTRVAQHVAHRELRIDVIRTTADQIGRTLVGTHEIAALDAADDQAGRRRDVVRVEIDRALGGRDAVDEQAGIAAAVARLEVVALRQRVPGGRVVTSNFIEPRAFFSAPDCGVAINVIIFDVRGLVTTIGTSLVDFAAGVRFREELEAMSRRPDNRAIEADQRGKPKL